MGGNFLIRNPVRGYFSALAKEDKTIGAVPILDNVKTLVDLTPEGFEAKIAAQEDRLGRAAQLSHPRRHYRLPHPAIS